MFVCICICWHINVCYHCRSGARCRRQRSQNWNSNHAVMTTHLNLVHLDRPTFLLFFFGCFVATQFVRQFKLQQESLTLGRRMILWREKMWLRTEGSWPVPRRGGSLRGGEGDGNYRNTMFLVSVPRIIPRNHGKSHPCRIVGSGSANTDVILIWRFHNPGMNENDVQASESYY